MKKRKDGRYATQIYIGREDTGQVDENQKPIYKRKYVTVYGNTQKELHKEADALRVKLGKGIDITAANDSFELWGKRYLERQQALGRSHSHLTGISINLAHLSSLNTMPLSKITTGDIEAIINRLAGWHDGKPPMAHRSLKGVRQTARAVFKMAIASRVVDYNPAEYATIPDGAAKSTRIGIPEEQQQWVVETKHRAQRAAMIMMYAGLRRGELLALTQADIDFENATIKVNKAVEFINGRPQLKDTTKTPAGMRTVNIPKVLVNFLQQDLATENCLYVAHTRDGRLLSKSAWKRMWESYMRELNIQYGFSEKEKEKQNITSRMHPEKLEMRIDTFTAHQLRHTYATLLYLAGVDILTARDQLGHTNIQTTLGIYTHLDKQYKLNSMGKLDEYLGSGNLPLRRIIDEK